MGDENAIVFVVDADDKVAQKRLEDLRKDIEKTGKALDKTSSQHNGLVNALEAAKTKAKETQSEIDKVQQAIFETTKEINNKKFPGGQAMIPPDAYADLSAKKAELLETQKTLQAQLVSENAEVEKISKKEETVRATLEEQTRHLEQQKQAAGEVEAVVASQARQALPNMRAAADQASAAVNRGIKSILKWGFGIRSTFILIRRLKSYIKEAVTAFAEQDEETKANVNGLKSALNALKLSWGAAFAPILNAVAPLLQTLIGWLTSAANAVARFFAVLGGKTSYKKAIANNEALANSYGSAGSAAKDAAKSVLGFDELNKLNDDSSGGGGGSGGASPGEMIEEAVDAESFAARLAFAVSDVLFDWSDLTAEQIAEKAIAGVYMLGGAIIGGMIGGVPGIIIGAAAGLALGIALDATIFNFDGELSQDEIMNCLKIALGAVGGIVIGLVAIGGPAGVAIGLALGLAIAFAGIMIDFEPVRAKIDEWALGIKNYFLYYINKWKESGSEEANGVGFYVVMGILEGLIMGVYEIGKWIYQRVIKPIIDFFCEALGIHSPSTVMEEIGVFMIEGLWNGVEKKWTAFLTWISGKWNSFKSWWQGLSLGSFSFHLPHLTVEWEELSSNSIINRLLGISAIPHFGVQWYAKGGIVDGATLIGAGEQGKEAIIPLERNTEWIRKVALELLDAMESRFENAYSGQLPLMASGQIVPPNVYNSGGKLFSDADVASIISAITGAISSNGDNQNQPLDVHVYLDGREISNAVTRYQRRSDRGSGM